MAKEFDEILRSLEEDQSFLNDCERIKDEISSHVEKRKQFVDHFSKRYIAEKMTLEEYAVGLGKSDSFCNTLEHGLSLLGYMGSGLSGKFGVYFSQDNHEIKVGAEHWMEGCADKLGAFENVRRAIVDLLDAGERGNLNRIARNKLAPTVKGKILSTYYPDKYLPIFSEDHIGDLLAFFHITYDPGLIKTIEGKKKILDEEIRIKHPFFANESMTFFMRFLYQPLMKSYWLTATPNKEIDHRKIRLVKTKSPNDHSPEDAHAHPFGTEGRNYVAEAEERKRIGERGEFAIVRYEKDRLSSLGRSDLAKRVKKVSGRDGDDRLGYDIESFEVDGDRDVPIHIEVKTTYRGANELGFYLTANEWSHFQSEPNYRLYCLFDVGKCPKLWAIRDHRELERLLTPILYWAFADAEFE